MALEGTLKDFSLADIFQLIGIQRKTGVLTLRSDKEIATISFINGMVVGADTDNQKLENRLGHVLVKTNRISQTELEQALAIQNSTLQRLGQVLISKGFIKKEDLRESLQTQVSEIIYRLFRWVDGDYHFRQERYIDYDQENFTPISAESLLMEGIRMIDEWPMIERVIPSQDILVQKTDRGRRIRLSLDDELSFQSGPAGSFDDILEGVMAEDTEVSEPDEEIPELSREQELVLKLIEAPVAVMELVEQSRFNEFDTCRAVYDLIEAGLVEKVVATAREQDFHVVEEERPLPTWIPVTAVTLFAAAMFLLSWNPLNVFFPSADAMCTQSPLFESVSKARLQRLVKALDIYYMKNESLPINLDLLVQSGLVDEQDTSDPLDRRYAYRYRPDEEGYALYGLDASGQQDEENLYFERRFGEPEEPLILVE